MEKGFQKMNEAATLAFSMGMIFAGYSRDFLASERHVQETLEYHCREMSASPEAFTAVLKIAIATFCR